MMNREEVLNEWIPYRLQAIDTLQFAWDLLSESDEPRELEVTVCGTVKLRGNVAAIANPMIEAGILHARALLEFLGLRADGGKLKAITNRRPDDIAVELFSTLNSQIDIVTPKQALSAYEGPKEDAEKALVAIFEWANKWLAHLTIGVVSSEYTDQHLDIACRGVRALVHNHLYAKLGKEIPKPPTWIKSSTKTG